MLINLTDSPVLPGPSFSSGGQSERKIKQHATKERRNWHNRFRTRIKLQHAVTSLITVKVEQQSKRKKKVLDPDRFQ